PASAMVGTFGNVGSRLSEVMARSFIFPPRTCLVMEPRFWNETFAVPLMRSRCAALPPLYGMWIPVVPVFCQKSAAVRWSEDPVPEEANETWFGFFFRYSISSATLFGGKFGCATSALG